LSPSPRKVSSVQRKKTPTARFDHVNNNNNNSNRMNSLLGLPALVGGSGLGESGMKNLETA